MHDQAPYAYIRDYYARVQAKNARWPEVAEFWQSGFGLIDGDVVLNAGCGPMLYDNLLRFARPPKEYVGLDLNQSTFQYLEDTDDPRIAAGKAHAAAAGTNVEYLCADMLAVADDLQGRFDSIVGSGFFGTFHGETFDRLLGVAFDALKPGGQLLKLTWHGPHRSPAETEAKLKYRYDNPQEPSPDDLVAGFERAGFRLASQDILECDPAEIGFEKIQKCLFTRPEAA